MAQAVLPGMKSEGYGRIINIISTSVKKPIQGLGVSNTIRAAVANWARSLAMDVGTAGITVNNVLPGYTDTDRLKSLISSMADSGNVSEEEVRNSLIGNVPLGRLAEPVEQANLIAFLASEAASYITGTSIAVDGGRT
jgi:3-oxoacyl-[acyl-carrier protein] reductase